MIKLHLQSENKRLVNISMDVIEITKSLEFTQSTLDEKLGTIKNGIKKLAFNMKDLENDLPFGFQWSVRKINRIRRLVVKK